MEILALQKNTAYNIAAEFVCVDGDSTIGTKQYILLWFLKRDSKLKLILIVEFLCRSIASKYL